MNRTTSWILFFSCMVWMSGAAQPLTPTEKLEVDNSVRVGNLDNGLRYYIKQNKKPAGCADFRIITNVGAIQETKAQDGLAHFLEHMAFNGTKNFPDKSILTYFEMNGAKFGPNINAGTGTEVTSYMLNNITLSREGVIDTSLLVLHDWLHHITLDPNEIDKERGVIIEEWRTRNGAYNRVYDQVRPILYAGTKFADCNIIGNKETLESFKTQELVDFYQKWYRPDLQAIVIVGDIDVDQIEAKVKTLFANIPKPTTPNPKQSIPPALNKEPAVKVITDKELTGTSITLYIKTPAPSFEANSLVASRYNNINQSLISMMWRERFSDITSRPNAPFHNASAYFGNLNSYTSALILSASCKDGGGAEAFKSLVYEMEKADRYGFTEAEFERAKTSMLRHLETAVANASTRQNAEFVGAYWSNFTSGTAYMTPQYNLDVTSRYLALLPLEALNKQTSLNITDENRVVILSSPEKEGIALPTEADLLATMTDIKSATIDPPKNEDASQSLLDATAIVPGKILSEKEDKFGTLLTLSNGARVYVRPTKLREDEIAFKSFALGGQSLLTLEELPSVESNVFYSYQRNAGLSSFPQTELKKMLTGKVAHLSAFIDQYDHGFNGMASPKDIETLFQLIYLQTTAPRFIEEEFDAGMGMLKSIIPNLIKDPNWQMNIEKSKILYDNNPRSAIISEASLAKVKMSTLEAVYRRLLGHANGVVYEFVGNTDMETLRPLIERYIASLPSGAVTEAADPGVRYAKGIINHSFEVEMETPKTTVAQVYPFKCEFNNEQIMLMRALSLALRITYTERVREQEGGTYGVRVSGSLTKRPIHGGSLLIQFDTNKEKAPKLAQITKEGLKEVAEKGLSDELMIKVKESLSKQFENEWQIHNNYWTAVIVDWMRDGIDAPTDYAKRVEAITNESIQKFAAEILAQGNLIELIMNPKQ